MIISPAISHRSCSMKHILIPIYWPTSSTLDMSVNTAQKYNKHKQIHGPTVKQCRQRIESVLLKRQAHPTKFWFISTHKRDTFTCRYDYYYFFTEQHDRHIIKGYD